MPLFSEKREQRASRREGARAGHPTRARVFGAVRAVSVARELQQATKAERRRRKYCCVATKGSPLPILTPVQSDLFFCSMSKTIPGLTASSFRAGSRHSVTETPTLVQSSVAAEDGSFEFCWTAKGTQVYTLRASGNLITSDTKKQCFSVDCSCPSFANQAMDRVPNVCKHLFAALTSVLDDGKPKASKPAASASSAPQQQRQRIGVIDLSLDESDDEEPKKKSNETQKAARSIAKREPRLKTAARRVCPPAKSKPREEVLWRLRSNSFARIWMPHSVARIVVTAVTGAGRSAARCEK